MICVSHPNFICETVEDSDAHQHSASQAPKVTNDQGQQQTPRDVRLFIRIIQCIQ